jgi:curved DNA-binding protein CbpA
LNPYEILGVARDATSDTIRRAFRTKAMRAHPDRGGTPEDMAAVNLAYELLSDKRRRKQYDETGQTQQGPTLRQEATQQIGLAVQAVIEAGSDDLLTHVREGIAKNQTEVANNLANLAQRQRRLQKLSGRYSTKAPVNIVQGVIDQQLAAIPEIEKRLKHAARVLAEASKVLSEYKDEQQLMEPMLASYFYSSPYSTGTMR